MTARKSRGAGREGVKALAQGVTAALADQQKRNPKVAEVTGRDGYIVAKALAYAIAAIDGLPKERQEGGDRDDMKRLLDHMVESDRQLADVIKGVRAHMTGEGWALE